MAFEPQNDLEKSLMQAAGDMLHRPQFIRDFLSADIYTIKVGPTPPPDETGRIEAGTVIRFVNLAYQNQPHIPIFTSVLRLQQFVKEETEYICMNTKALLEMTLGAKFLLNPGSDYGKQFTANEIASYLDGSFWDPGKRRVVQKEEKILIGQPAKAPQELIDALARLFKTMPEVKRAFLAHYYNPMEQDPPHTLIGLEINGEWDPVSTKTGVVINQAHVPDPPVDLVQITGKGGLEDYFLKQCQPFYEKRD